MILTVTLNPAVDKTYTTGALMLGQVNRMRTAHNIAGGKGINVAKILRQYGYEVMVMGFLGGYTGQFIEEYMKGIHAECRFTHVAGETRSSKHALHQGGFAGSIFSHQGMDRTRPQIQLRTVQCFHTWKCFYDIVHFQTIL